MKDRAEELLVENALRPLDAAERAELDQLVPGGDASFDAAAAAVVVATTRLEPMPQHVADKIIAAFPRPDLKRTLAGVVPPQAELARDTLVGVDLAAFAPAEAPPVAQPLVAPPPVAPVIDLGARREQRRRSTIAPWLAAAACLLVACGAVWIALRRDHAITSPVAGRAALLANAGDAATLAWTATADPTAHGARGDVVWSSTQQRGFMRFVGLAPNDPHQFQYQLWIFDKDRDEKFPVDGGVFDVSSTGEVVVAISAKLHVTDATLFAVTVEQPGGVVVSKRERIVVTAACS